MKQKRKRIFRGKKKLIAALSLSLALSLLLSVSSFAYMSAEIDEDEPLSLSVFFETDYGAAQGAKISIYRVADVYVENYVVFYSALIGEYDYTGMSAEESAQAASELASLVSQPYASAEVGEDGEAVFEDLEKGMYLVVLDEDYVISDDGTYIYTFEPFLAAVPLADESSAGYVGWTYSVSASPKSADVSYEPLETTEEGGETPTTGQEENLQLYIILFASAAVILVILIVVSVRRKKR